MVKLTFENKTQILKHKNNIYRFKNLPVLFKKILPGTILENYGNLYEYLFFIFSILSSIN